MKTKISVCILLILFACMGLAAQTTNNSTLDYDMVPSWQAAFFLGTAFPVEGVESALFNPALCLNTEFDFFLPFWAELSGSTRLGYKLDSHFQGVDLYTSTFDLSFGPRYSFFINDMWQISLFGRGGIYFALLHGQPLYDFSGTLNTGVNAKIKVTPEIGIDVNAGYRADFGLSVSQLVLEAGVTYQSLYKKYPQLLDFTVSKPTEQPYVTWKNLFDKPVEILSAQIVFKEKYLKPINLKVTPKASAGEVVYLTILDKLTDDIFQLNRGKVAGASVTIKYKGYGQSFSKTLPIDISFKPEVLRPFVQVKINEAQQNIYWYGATDANQNKLGVVYARYGLYDEALNVFSNIVAVSEYVPSLMNLGSIYMLKKDYFRALPFFERAKAKEPYNAKVLVALAKAQMSVENFGSAKAIYDTLEAINPALAKEYTWFKLTGDAARKAAESSNMKTIIVWAE